MTEEETTQFRKVSKMVYSLNSGELGMIIDGYGRHSSKLDSMDIDPKKIAIEELSISTTSVSMQFKNPITCNLKSDGFVTTMDCGVMLEGSSPSEFIEKISVVKKSTDWDKKVDEFRTSLQQRWKISQQR